MSDEPKDGDYIISFKAYETIYRTRKQQISYLKKHINIISYLLRKGNICDEEVKGFKCLTEELNRQIAELEIIEENNSK